jgi:prepilin-type processing-associated H-X9-DG protein
MSHLSRFLNVLFVDGRTPQDRTAQIEDSLPDIASRSLNGGRSREDDDENEYDWQNAPNAERQSPNAKRRTLTPHRSRYEVQRHVARPAG